MNFDVFISHASEDKDEFVRPLAAALTLLGLKVWYDEATLTLGDSLRKKIDEGLVASRYGVVVLSPSFLAKEWPQAELNALFAREMQGQKTILPVWHGLAKEELLKLSPLLADKLAIKTEQGVEKVAEAIFRTVRPDTQMPSLADGFSISVTAKPKTIPQALPDKGQDEQEVFGVVRRLKRMLSAHGLVIAQWPRFLQLAKAPFSLRHIDLQSDDAILGWIDDQKLRWFAQCFNVRYEWLEGEDDYIQEGEYFDKDPEKFYSVICREIESLSSVKDVERPYAYFLRDRRKAEWESSERQEVFFVLQVPVVRLSDQLTIYRYVADASSSPWNYDRTQIQMRAWVRLLLHEGIHCFGGEMEAKAADEICAHQVFWHELLKDRRVRTNTWHPDDYAMENSKNIHAKKVETLPDVIAFLSAHGLPTEGERD